MAKAARSAGRGRARLGSPRRQHQRQGPSLRLRPKRGAQVQAIGRSRGGSTTKIHLVTDAKGRPLAFKLSPGHRHDVLFAADLVEPLPPARLCIADTAYDSDAFRGWLEARKTKPVIPNNPTRKRHHAFDRNAYRLRNLVERAFCRLKDWRRIATRYDRLKANYEATIAIAILLIWWT